MGRGYTHPKHGGQRGLARRAVNRCVGRVKRVFKWGVGEELVPAPLWETLRSVEGLECGRTEARETKPVAPVASEVVEATSPHLLQFIHPVAHPPQYPASSRP